MFRILRNFFMFFLILFSINAFSATENDFALFNEMQKIHLVPYQNIPDAPGKTMEQIIADGQRYFPNNENSTAYSLALYDWTSPSFARVAFFNNFVYTRAVGTPLDINSIAAAIWNTNWPPYTPHNVDFMNSFLLQPADSLDNIKMQFQQRVCEPVAGCDTRASLLRTYDVAQSHVMETALSELPRIDAIKTQVLYRGAIPISSLKDLGYFSSRFLQFSGNSNPSQALYYPIDDALRTLIYPNQTLTTKSFWAFSDNYQDSLKYQNGIVIIAHPPRGDKVWPVGAYITPLSDDPNKIEYLMPPNTQYKINQTYWQTVQGKKILFLDVTILG